MVELVPASPAHVGPIASRMREADVLESAALGYSPKQALRVGIRGSLMAFTAKVDGRPEAMMGLAPVSLIEGIGRPWMLGSDLIYRHGRELLAFGPKMVGMMRESTPRLENIVAASNGRAIRLLRRWGFAIADHPEMIGGVQFLRFSMPAIQADGSQR